MTDITSSNKKDSSSMNWKKILLICSGIIIAAVLIIVIIFLTEPTAQRETETKQTAMLVDVITVERGDFHPIIVATGTVAPAQDVILSPRISGEVISRSESFTPGGYAKKGEVLLEIDPSDYENQLQQRRSELLQAEADLNIEMGRQSVAKKDYELLDESLRDENKSLVLREPQLKAAQSRVESAKAAVKQAELELMRTTIRAPFDAQVLRRNVNIGSQVSPGMDLGRLVGLDNYWVITTIPLSQIKWLDFQNGTKGKGSRVRIQNRTAWKETQYREGYLYKLIGELSEQTRLARVLVTIPDPLLHQADSSGKPLLMIGEFVELQIQGKEIKDIIRLNRDYVRKDNAVWVKKNNKLNIREVDILLQDAEYAYISNGIAETDSVVTTNLSTVVDGAKLRTQTSNPKNNYDSLSTKKGN